jgi:hypothetical protein
MSEENPSPENLPVEINPTPAGPIQVLSVILSMARDSSLDISKLQTLLEMQQKMEARQAEIEYIRALARLAAQLPQVPKNGRVTLGTGKGSYPFAKWEDMDKVIRPLMAEEGFVLTFDSTPQQGGCIVTGTLLHRDGHSRTSSMFLSLDTGPGRNDLQAMGSTISYGKRYAAEMLLNIVREGADNDGNGVVKAPGFGR